MPIPLVVFLLLTLLLPYLSFLLTSKNKLDYKRSDIKIIAHRGASGYAPENTLASFEKAINMGVDMVELDVHLTADDSVVVMHDPKVDRTTNGKGIIREMNFSALRNLDAGQWFSREYAGQKVPTLSEVLSLVSGKAKVLIELKWPPDGLYPNLVDKVMDIVDQHNARSWIILQSFEITYLKDASLRYPNIIQQQLLFGKSGIIPFYFDRGPHFGSFEPFYKSTSVNVFYMYASKQFIETMHDNHKTVFAFTPNNEGQMRRLIHLGADGLITNFPDIALKLVNENSN